MTFKNYTKQRIKLLSIVLASTCLIHCAGGNSPAESAKVVASSHSALDTTFSDGGVVSSLISRRALPTFDAEIASTTINLDAPSSLQPGDLLVAHMTVRADVTDDWTLPTGWTLLRKDNSLSQIASAIYWHVAGSSEPASYTFTFPVALNITGDLTAFYNVNQANPIDTHSGFKTATTTALTGAAVTVTNSHSLVLWYASQSWDSTNLTACPSGFFTAPANSSEGFASCALDSSSFNGMLYVLYYQAIGDPGTYTFSGTSNYPNTNIIQTVVLNADN